MVKQSISRNKKGYLLRNGTIKDKDLEKILEKKSIKNYVLQNFLVYLHR